MDTENYSFSKVIFLVFLVRREKGDQENETSHNYWSLYFKPSEKKKNLQNEWIIFVCNNDMSEETYFYILHIALLSR